MGDGMVGGGGMGGGMSGASKGMCGGMGGGMGGANKGMCGGMGGEEDQFFSSQFKVRCSLFSFANSSC